MKEYDLRALNPFNCFQLSHLMKIKRLLYCLCVVIGLSSCATVINGTREYVTIHTNQPAKIFVNGDSSKMATKSLVADVPRSKKPLWVEAYRDSVHKMVQVRAHSSFYYYLNLITFWPGMFIDMNSPGRYTYPKNLYLDMNQGDSSFMLMPPLNPRIARMKNQIRFTPFKLLDFSNASFTLGYERSMNSSFSVGVNGSSLLTNSIWNQQGSSSMNTHTRGYGYSIEGKYFFDKSGPTGTYFSMEFNYLKSHYQDHGTIYSYYPARDSINAPGITDTATMRKKNLTFNFKFGYQKFYNHLVIDFSIGLGLRLKNTSLYDPKNPGYFNSNLYIYQFDWWNFNDNTGKYWTPTIPINIRIGWLF